MPTPEDKARDNIDRLLAKAGWAVRDQNDANILAYRGVAIRNFTLKPGHGFADYLLYVDGRAAGRHNNRPSSLRMKNFDSA
jgi:type I restriction enzyme, R subunit